MTISVCLAGATGWAGSALARCIVELDDIRLVAAVSRSNAGRTPAASLDEPRLTCPVYATAEEALAIRKVHSFIGLRRGLDTVLDLA